jgi:hypothetical protein
MEHGIDKFKNLPQKGDFTFLYRKYVVYLQGI